jgi:hypothetical protein
VTDQKSGVDLFGLAPYGEAVNTLTKAMCDGASAVLSRVCLPAAQEFGLTLGEAVHNWRTTRRVRLLLKTKQLLDQHPESEGWHASPRVVAQIIEQGSWSDSDDLQEMWAGLLASACTADGKDESNLMFVGFLSQLTGSQAKALAYGAERATKEFTVNGLVLPRGGPVFVNESQLMELTGVNDLNRLDRELDHLHALGLLTAGMVIDAPFIVMDEKAIADLRPTPLGFEMYVRCRGWRNSAASYPDWPDGFPSEFSV